MSRKNKGEVWFAKLRFESFARIDKYLLLDDIDFSF